MNKRIRLLIFFGVFAGCSTVGATEKESAGLEQMEKLLAMGFDELANVRLTTASRKDQRLADVAAAVYVIDQEEIRRSGMNNLPELLRMVPGLNVARIDSSNWAVSSRGFNGQYANKLLVLMDGRTIYSPLFGGVFWSLQEVMLEDVERIEVIRGPGGTMWGANAVNGVINIITKKAGDTQGGLVSAGVGSLDKRKVALRYGGKIQDKMAYRLFLRNVERSEFTQPASLYDDHWHAGHGGGRLDWQVSSTDEISVIGNLFHAQDATETFHDRGENILLRWTRRVSAEEEIKLQYYFDHLDQNNVEKRSIHDIDFQHRFPLLSNQEIIWGMAYRGMGNTITSNRAVTWWPHENNLSIYSLFLQDEIELIPDQLKLTLGSKVEHQPVTGWEMQPNARLLWRATPEDTLWASVSRAVRSPSLSDTGFSLNIPTGPFTRLQIAGNPRQQSESQHAFEVGYRKQLSDKVFVDIAGFYNDYDHLLTSETGVRVAPPNVIVTKTFANLGVGRTQGVETSLNWQVQPDWKVRASYTLLNMSMGVQGGSTDTDMRRVGGASPRHQAQMRSYLDITPQLSLDTALFYVSSLPAHQLSDYWRWDLHLGWKLDKQWSVSLVGQNLLDEHHPEYVGTSAVGREIPRSIFANLEFGF
ncbi:MAG: TonB-dependent receptor [Magnetococcales bacterium]|nr:TonB-dependent receptor [Magnetococcales bacterium]NGZ26358.1 TonB-dependent receptor [Magnetococcales bacterium]